MQISVVTDCTVKRLGDLPFDFNQGGTCGTFMISNAPTIFLCFTWTEGNACQSFTRRNNGSLSSLNDFSFHAEFEIDEINIPKSTYHHHLARIANYQGFPLVVGGKRENGPGHDKLEWLNTMENPSRWMEGTDFPYSNT